MQSNSLLYIIPQGYMELTQALHDTVRYLFGGRFVRPPARAKTFFENQRRVSAAEKLIRGALQSGGLNAYVWKNGSLSPLDRSYWDTWPSLRAFAQTGLGVPDEPVYLLTKNSWEQWVIKNRWRGAGNNRRATPEAASVNPQKSGSILKGSTGTAGRPTSKHLCMDEMKRWHGAGKLPPTLSETCRALLGWLKTAHPEAPRTQPKSLENSIRHEYWALKKPSNPTP